MNAKIEDLELDSRVLPFDVLPLLDQTQSKLIQALTRQTNQNLLDQKNGLNINNLQEGQSQHHRDYELNEQIKEELMAGAFVTILMMMVAL